MEISGELKDINNIEYTNTGNNRDSFSFTFSSYRESNFSFLKSKDEEKIAIRYTYQSKKKSDKNNYEKISVYVYDFNMNNLWSKQYTMPHTERRLEILDYTVTSNGDIYSVTRLFHDNSNKDFKNNERDSHIEIIKLSKNSDDFKNVKMSLGNYYLSDVSLFEERNTIRCVGFYNKTVSNANTFKNRKFNNSRRSNADRIFSFTINENDTLIEDTKYEIPIEVIVKYLGNGRKRKMQEKNNKNKAEFANLKFKNLVFCQDGGIIIIGEQTYSVASGPSMGFGASSSMDFVGGGGNSSYIFLKDLFIAKINNLGEIIWMDRLAKRQRGDKILDKSFSYLKMKNKHCIVFLDNIKNLDLKEEEVPDRHDDNGKNGYLTIYEIDDKTGKVEKDAVFNLKKITNEISGHLFNVKRIVRVSDEEFVLELYKKNQKEILIKVKRKN